MYTREIDSVTICASSRHALQWGPGLYTREMRPRRRSPSAPGPASMGPGFVHPGNIVLATVEPVAKLSASMGPGFVHPGNRQKRARISRLEGLQWGPGLYTREITPPPGRPTAESSGFNGARVCTPGKFRRGARAAGAAAASMGPGFVHPGNHRRQPPQLCARLASMGPGFVHPGNRHLNHRARHRRGALQWGPGLYTREMRKDPLLHRCGHASFNGARVCTPGKSARDRGGPAVETVASMGPGFVHPGNTSVALTNVPFLRASMGPGFVHPGNPFREKRT